MAKSAKHHVRLALGSLFGAGVVMVLISGAVNILALTGSFYMLQVYDRVLSSRSVPTLIALSILAAGLYFSKARSKSCARNCWSGSGRASSAA